MIDVIEQDAPTFKIDKNIPLPPRRAGRKKSSLDLAMQNMAVGDSIYLEMSRSTIQNVALRNIGKGHHAIRQEGPGYRVWRTK